jgi:hypothetical protein
MPSLSISDVLANAAAAAGVPFELLFAQAQKESGLNPNAYNRATGATGILQLEPATARSLGVTNSLDPVANANAGARYLAQLYDRFGSWDLALAAYDWGPTRLQTALDSYGTAWLAHAPAETQNYVSGILAAAGMDTQTTITPASVVNGAAQMVQKAVTGGTPAAPNGSTGKLLLLTGFALGAWLLAEVLGD